MKNMKDLFSKKDLLIKLSVFVVVIVVMFILTNTEVSEILFTFFNK